MKQLLIILTLGLFTIQCNLLISAPQTSTTDIEICIRHLKSQDESARYSAAKRLCEIGEPAVRPLINELKNKNRYIRTGIVELLSKIGIPSVDSLIIALKDKNNLVREGAAEALGNIGDKRAVEPLISLLNDEDVDVRNKDIYALGKMGDSRAIQPLILSVKDDYEDVGFWIEGALEKLSEQGVNILISELKNENKCVRYTAAEVLGKIGDKRAIKPLAKLLNDKDRDVRDISAISLGNLGDKRVTKLIINSLSPLPPQSQSEGCAVVMDMKVTIKIIEAKSALVKIGEPAIEDLIIALKSDNENVRSCAQLALKEIGETAIPYLIKALKDNNVNVRRGAISLLNEINIYYKRRKMYDEKIPLFSLLKDKDERVRVEAGKALCRMDESIIKAALKDENKYIREGAVMALGEIRNEEVIEPIISALKDEYEGVRKTAAYVLYEKTTKITGMRLETNPETIRILREKAVESLITLLKDENEDVQLAALMVLGQISDERAVGPLITLLQSESKKVRMSTVYTLGKIGGGQIIESLTDMLKDEDETVREAAGWALGNISKPAIDTLINQLKDENKYIREGAIRALGVIGDKESNKQVIVLIVSALNDNDENVRKAAAKALQGMSTKLYGCMLDQAEPEIITELRNSAVIPLITALKDKNEDVRKAALDALGYIDDIRTIEPITDTLNDKAENVRMASVEALCNIALRSSEYEQIKPDKEKVIILRKLAVRPLISLFKDENKDIRERAVLTMGLIGDRRAIKSLIDTLKDSDISWHFKLNALKNITGKNFGRNYNTWLNWWRKQKVNNLIKQREI